MSETPKTWRNERAIICCALAALLLVAGTIGGWTFSALRQRKTIAAIKAATADARDDVNYDYELGENFELTTFARSGPVWLGDRLGVDFFATARQATLVNASDEQVHLLTALPGLRSISLSGKGLTDKGVAALRRLPELDSVMLDSLEISDEGLAVLAELRHLQMLSINECPRITDAGLEHLSRITGLKALKLKTNSYLTSAGLAQLHRLKNLEILWLRVGSQAADAALDNLQTLPRLRELKLEYRDWAPVGSGLRHLAGFASLEKLELSGEHQPADEALAELPTLPGIKTLTLSYCPALTAAGLKNLEKFPNVETLDLADLPGLDDARLTEIARLPKVCMLAIRGVAVQITDAGMESLGGMSSLRVLSLVHCGDLSDDGLKHLARLKDLKELELDADRPNQFSTQAIEDLKKSLPHCRLEYYTAGAALTGSSP